MKKNSKIQSFSSQPLHSFLKSDSFHDPQKNSKLLKDFTLEVLDNEKQFDIAQMLAQENKKKMAKLEAKVRAETEAKSKKKPKTSQNY